MESIFSPKTYWKNCAGLLMLLALTWGVGYLNLGMFNLIAALAISFIKMILIALFFMHLRGSSRLLHLAAATGLLWLLLMLILTLGDYYTRTAGMMPKY